MNRGSILLRADGTSKDGMGRLARCLALANALQRRRYQMTFLSRTDHPAWPDRIRRHRHSIVRTAHESGSMMDKGEFLRQVEERQPVMVVTDADGYDEEFLAGLSHRVPLVITIDETPSVRFPSDIVLNPSLGHESKSFELYPGTQVLAGDRYAMVRSEFRRARNVRATEPGGAVRVLVALGGGEVGGPTVRIVESLLHEKTIEKVDAVIGTSSEGRDELRRLAEEFPGRLTVAPDARDLAFRITKSHLLVTGGGNTPLEAACVGIPTIVLHRCDRQQLNAERLEEIGVAHWLGAMDEASGSKVAKTAVEILTDNFERKSMSRSGRMMIDGRGADRLVTATEILLRRCRRSKALLAA